MTRALVPFMGDRYNMANFLYPLVSIDWTLWLHGYATSTAFATTVCRDFPGTPQAKSNNR